MDTLKETIETYDNHAEDYAKKWQKNRPEPWKLLIEQFAEKLPKKARVLDAGCGPGGDTKLLADKGFETCACDLSAEMLKLASEFEPRAEYDQADIQNLPYEGEFFDGLVCCAVLHHLEPESQLKAIKELYRVLKLEGGLLLSTKVSKKPGIFVDKKYGSPRVFYLQDPGTLVSALRNTGFSFTPHLERIDADTCWLTVLGWKFSLEDLLSQMREGALAWGSGRGSGARRYR